MGANKKGQRIMCSVICTPNRKNPSAYVPAHLREHLDVQSQYRCGNGSRRSRTRPAAGKAGRLLPPVEPAARRNADAEIEAEVLLQAAVQHASAVNAPQAATHIDDTVFHGLFLHRLIPFPSQYNGTAGNTH